MAVLSDGHGLLGTMSVVLLVNIVLVTCCGDGDDQEQSPVYVNFPWLMRRSLVVGLESMVSKI